MEIPIIYEDQDCLVVTKPAGIICFPEGNHSSTGSESLINILISEKPELTKAGEAPRYGIVHRLDKDTSGLLLVAKSSEALIFLQKQFKNRDIEKKYLALVTGTPKDDIGTIETFIGRSPGDPRKQVVLNGGDREAITKYKTLKKFEKYTLLEVDIKTGRKHQIRCHMAYIHHPIAGDALYSFKDSPKPEGLQRQFLHASYLKIILPNGSKKEFTSQLPEDLENILKIL